MPIQAKGAVNGSLRTRIEALDPIPRREGHVARRFDRLQRGQEELAQTMHDETVARIAATTKTVKHAPARGLTVRGFVAEWLPKRRERGMDWKADEGRLNRHVLPHIGDLPIAEVRARHLVDMFHKLRTDPNLNLAPRPIYNIYSVVSAVFRDAKLADLIEQSPCVLDERHLGSLIDKDRAPRWRAPGGSLGAALAPLRSDGAPARQALGGEVVQHPRRREDDKDGRAQARAGSSHARRDARRVEARRVGRDDGPCTGPDDLIVPLPPDAAERRYKRKGEPFRTTYYSGKCWRKNDLRYRDGRTHVRHGRRDEYELTAERQLHRAHEYRSSGVLRCPARRWPCGRSRTPARDAAGEARCNTSSLPDRPGMC
jgi:hypothetical protein